MAIEKVSGNELNNLKTSLKEEKDFKKAVEFMKNDDICYPTDYKSAVEFTIGEPIEVSNKSYKKLKKNGDLVE